MLTPTPIKITTPQTLIGDPYTNFTTLCEILYHQTDGSVLGSRNEMVFGCGCGVTFFVPNQPPPYADGGCCGVCTDGDLGYCRTIKRLVCPQHSAPGFLSYTGYVACSNFGYDCPTCFFPFELSEDFSCEGESWEYDSAVHASQQFGGNCGGVENCPICNTPINYEEVYSNWVEWAEDQRLEYLADRGE